MVEVRGILGSQEFEVSVYTERLESEAEEMDGVHRGL